MSAADKRIESFTWYNAERYLSDCGSLWKDGLTSDVLYDFAKNNRPNARKNLINFLKAWLIPLNLDSEVIQTLGTEFFGYHHTFKHFKCLDGMAEVFTSVICPISDTFTKSEAIEVLRKEYEHFEVSEAVDRLCVLYGFIPDNFKKYISKAYFDRMNDTVYLENSTNSLEFFARYLKECSLGETSYFEKRNNTQDKITYSLPYVVLCQKSGSGKTRMLLEVGKRHNPLIYVSLKHNMSPDNITSYLKELKVPEKELSWETKDQVHEKAKRLLAAMYCFAHDKINLENMPLPEFMEFFRPYSGYAKDAWDIIIKNAEKTGADDVLDRFYKIPRSDNFFVFAFDEASVLTNQVNFSAYTPFDVLRIASFQLLNNGQRKFIIIFADSQLKVTTFHELKAEGGSYARIAFYDNTIPPFFAFSSSDIHAGSSLLKIQGRFKEDLSGQGPWMDFLSDREKNQEDIISFGSPLWTDYFKDKENFEMSKLLEYAKFKLFKNVLVEYKGIVCLASRCVLTMPPSSHLSKNLASNSMYQIDYLTLDKKLLYTSFYSDPTLSAAAAEFLNSNGCGSLKSLREHLSNSEIDIGDAGETMAQIILLSAMDKLRGENMPFDSINVLAYLRLLLCVDTDDKLKKFGIDPEALSGARLHFNHFTRLDEPIQYENLAFALGRCAALLICFGQPVFNMFIPFVLSNGKLSSINLQIMNFHDCYIPSADESNSMVHFLAHLRARAIKGSTESKFVSEDEDVSDDNMTDDTQIEADPAANVPESRPGTRAAKRQKPATTSTPKMAETLPSINLVINLRQGRTLFNSFGPFVTNSGVIVIPCVQPGWALFLWANGEECLDLIRSFLCNDKEKRCVEERPESFIKYLDNTDHLGTTVMSLEHSVIYTPRN